MYSVHCRTCRVHSIACNAGSPECNVYAILSNYTRETEHFQSPCYCHVDAHIMVCAIQCWAFDSPLSVLSINSLAGLRQIMAVDVLTGNAKEMAPDRCMRNPPLIEDAPILRYIPIHAVFHFADPGQQVAKCTLLFMSCLVLPTASKWIQAAGCKAYCFRRRNCTEHLQHEHSSCHTVSNVGQHRTKLV